MGFTRGTKTLTVNSFLATEHPGVSTCMPHGSLATTDGTIPDTRSSFRKSQAMRSLFFGANLSNEQLIAQGKDNGPFACADIENQTGKYEKTRNRCGPAKSCRFPNVTQPADNIFNQERYMTICSYNSEGTRQNCPNEDTYPWLETDNVNPCGGSIPCKDAVNCKL